MSAAEVGDSLEVTSLAVGSALIRLRETRLAGRVPGFLHTEPAGRVWVWATLWRINTVISDLNFCRHLALKYARHAVYSKDPTMREAFTAKARGFAELALAVQAYGPLRLSTAGELHSNPTKPGIGAL
jgi:hypothetical protein